MAEEKDKNAPLADDGKVWRRMLAYALDLLIATVPAYGIVYFATGLMPRVLLAAYPSPLVGVWFYMRAVENPEGVLLAGMWLGAAFYLLSATLSALIFRGRTAGKRIMGLEVSPPEKNTVTGILTRELLLKALLNSILPVAVVSILFVVIRKDHRAIHDMIMKTDVQDAPEPAPTPTAQKAGARKKKKKKR
ncbi:RDD family protein [Oscillospiraceae bacterium OttesenSCG-928-F05]|nr:RDD family protein [Oscillospiraceae bacterium OttesenSCG-928-F05]